MKSEYYLYDMLLVGRKETIGKELFETTVNGRKVYNAKDEDKAIDIIRYACEYYLGWTPEQTYQHMSPELLKELKLDTLVRQRIRFPVELDPMNNMAYLCHLMYPDRFRYNKALAVENYYQDVLDGRLNRFKKGFFVTDDGTGRERACICFRKMLGMIGPFKNVREIYDLFAKADGNRYISKYKLASAFKNIFEYPIDYLHYSLPPANRDEFYYHKKRFELTNAKQKKTLKKKEQKVPKEKKKQN